MPSFARKKSNYIVISCNGAGRLAVKNEIYNMRLFPSFLPFLNGEGHLSPETPLATSFSPNLHAPLLLQLLGQQLLCWERTCLGTNMAWRESSKDARGNRYVLRKQRDAYYFYTIWMLGFHFVHFSSCTRYSSWKTSRRIFPPANDINDRSISLDRSLSSCELSYMFLLQICKMTSRSTSTRSACP